VRLAIAPLIALATSVSRAPPPDAPAVTKHMLFVVVTHGASPSYSRADYNTVLARTATTLDRDTSHHVQLEWSMMELPFGDAELGYGVRTFREWFDDLRDATKSERYDALAFAPDRPLRWCTDAHSLGVVFDGVAFTCLEAPAPVPLASNLLVHKLFHTFGFFHQQLRNKQWRLLDWEIGLPGYTSFADVGAEPEPFIAPFALAAPWSCAPGDAPGECRDVVGPFTRDVDGDGIRDDRDGYPASPPRGLASGEREGPDSDHDGIPDALDLCPGNEIPVSGLEGGPMTYWTRGAHAHVVTPFSLFGETRWTPVSFAEDKRLGDLIYFDDALERAGDTFDVPRGLPVRVRVVARGLRRTFYVYGESALTSPGPWGYFDETEWLYFGRFGCDPPATLDTRDLGAFDANADGLPDALAIPPGYDWDGDGVPDRDDTLPTVAGHCSNARVRGVKDSDGDGFCDPGRFSFAPFRTEHSFGELPVVFDDPEADRCPYRAGRNMGCPE
jgi:hypothetical protein